MVLPPTGGGDGGVRHTGTVDICHLLPEHIHKIYCNKAHYGPMSGGIVEPGGNGTKAVVGAGWPGPGGDMDGGLDGGLGSGGYGER